LGVNPDASWEEVQKAYKEKIAKSHPDKVAHLSDELQNKAKELTLQLNKAIDIIRRYKNV
jgi:DnaJ-class molecular chaperone